MQSISLLSVMLHCLCYVIIISYLALHCPNNAPNHSCGISQNCSNLCSLPLGWERLYTLRLIPPPHLIRGGGRGRGRNMCCREERRESLRRTPTISIFTLPVSIFRTPSGSSQLGMGREGGPSTVTGLCRGWGGRNIPPPVKVSAIQNAQLHLQNILNATLTPPHV
jgi:hypothetical protein